MRIVLQGGDNMLGRAVQLTLPYRTPGDENIMDSQSAQDYLNDILPNANIEEIRNQNYDGSYLWNDIPYDLEEAVRIINLEVAPTLSIDNANIPPKSIHYHMNIQNIPHVFARFTRPYVLCLANNHSIDMGFTAFVNETIPIMNSFQTSSLYNAPQVVGVGLDSSSAYAPRIVKNIAVFAFGAGCAGVPHDWQASVNKPGVAYLPPIVNEINVNLAFEIIHQAISPVNDKCIVVSIHWGPNWATKNDGQEYRELLAHRLIDEAGVDLIHGHSSHHIRGIELYKNKLILYGAGDFVNDYEAIPSSYDTAGALYVIDLDDSEFTLTGIRFIPFEMKELRCRQITDTQRIKSLRGFINKHSIQDSANPLLL